MKITYEPGDVVKLADDERAGEFHDCKVILLHQQPHSFHATDEERLNWKVKVYPDEGFAEEDSIGVVNECYFISDFN